MISLGNSLDLCLGSFTVSKQFLSVRSQMLPAWRQAPAVKLVLHKSLSVHKPRRRHACWVPELVPTASNPSPPLFHAVWVGLAPLPKCKTGHGTCALPIRAFYPRGWRCPPDATGQGITDRRLKKSFRKSPSLFWIKSYRAASWGLPAAGT